MLVISNGMLRSGSTLQYNIAAAVLETQCKVQRVGFLGNLADPKLTGRLKSMKLADGWAIIKTHDAPLPVSFYTERVHVLFSYRDVRDIASSISKKWEYPFEKILKDVDMMIKIEQDFSNVPNVLRQSYGLLYRDIAAAAHEIAKYLGICLEPDEAGQIAETLSISSVKSQIECRSKSWLTKLRRKSLLAGGVDQKTLIHDDHISVSAGRDGDWVRIFSEDEIELLTVRYSGWLRSHGFLTEADHPLSTNRSQRSKWTL